MIAPDRNAGRQQDRFPLLVRAREKRLLQSVDERRAIGDARGVRSTKRGSAAYSGNPISGQNIRHSLSLPMPSARSRVFVRNVWYGSSAAYAVPQGFGTMPSARYAPKTLCMMLICPSSIEMSMNWPRPVRSRAWMAIMMPSAENIPAVMSAIDTPHLTPGPPSGPVTLIMPLSACTIRSSAARSRYGPSWPNPEIEQ